MSFPEGRKDWSMILFIIIELLKLIVNAFEEKTDNESNR